MSTADLSLYLQITCNSLWMAMTLTMAERATELYKPSFRAKLDALLKIKKSERFASEYRMKSMLTSWAFALDLGVHPCQHLLAPGLLYLPSASCQMYEAGEYSRWAVQALPNNADLPQDITCTCPLACHFMSVSFKGYAGVGITVPAITRRSHQTSFCHCNNGRGSLPLSLWRNISCKWRPCALSRAVYIGCADSLVSDNTSLVTSPWRPKEILTSHPPQDLYARHWWAFSFISCGSGVLGARCGSLTSLRVESLQKGYQEHLTAVKTPSLPVRRGKPEGKTASQHLLTSTPLLSCLDYILHCWLLRWSCCWYSWASYIAGRRLCSSYRRPLCACLIGFDVLRLVRRCIRCTAFE